MSVPAGGLVFRDRRDAGVRLGALLADAELPGPVVYGIARGGVPVAGAVADALDAPLDVVLARKVGAPGRSEYAIGAVAEGGVRLLSRRALERLRIDREQADELVATADSELADVADRYAAVRRGVDPVGATAVVVDDGLATGHTAAAAIRSIRQRGARRVVLAAPVAARDAAEALRGDADEVVCLIEPVELWAVGHWYEDFSPTTDDEVFEVLREHGQRAEREPRRS